MSMRELFKEHLEKEFGIKLTPKAEWKVFDRELVINLDDSLIKIYDPQIVREAKAAVDDEIFKQLYSPEEILERIYAIKVTYGEIKMDEIPFSKFKKSYETMSKEEIMNELMRVEEKYIKSKNITPEKLRKYMLTSVYAYSLRKSPSIPTGLSYEELPYTTQDLAKIIARLSEKERFSLGEELGIYYEEMDELDI